MPVQRTVGMGTAVAAAMTNMLAASAVPVASNASVAVAGGQQQGEEDLEAEIRSAMLAGDEAKAFRLVRSMTGPATGLCMPCYQAHRASGLSVSMCTQAMQKILSTACEDARSSRRGFILAQVCIMPLNIVFHHLANWYRLLETRTRCLSSPRML